MLVNQRPYQLVYSRSGSAAAAYTVAALAKAAGYLFAFTGALLCRAEDKRESESELYASAQKIFPKPDFSLGLSSSLPAQDSDIDLSVIVPVHNTERYIESCIESVLQQKSSFRVQLILVDDGSTDHSYELMEKYRSLPDVICIRHASGSNAATARNAGLLQSSGKYIMFLDSDDELSENAVEALMQAARSSDADIVQGGWQYMDEAGVCGDRQIYAAHSYTGKTRCHVTDLPGMPWAKVYRRRLFENIRFPYTYSCFEDAIIHFLVFPSAERIISVPQIVYHWRKNSQGITARSQNRPAALQAYWIVPDLIRAYEALGLPKDRLYMHNLIMQLSNYCYVCVRGMDEAVKHTVFLLCSDLYCRSAGEMADSKLPYAVRLGQRALSSRNFRLWQLQGKLFQLIK